MPATTAMTGARMRTTLSRREVRLVRIAWFMLAGVVLLVTLTGIPVRYEKVRAGDPFIRNPEFRNLVPAGVPADVAATLDVALGAFQCAALFAAAAFLFARGSDAPAVIFLSITLIVFGAGFSGLTSAHRTPGPPFAQSAVGMIATVVSFLTSAFSWTALYWLPQARFVSRGTAALSTCFVVLLAGLYFLVSYPRSHELVNLLGVAAVALGIAAQIQHYRQVRDSVARQQIKWAVIGIVIAAAGFLTMQTTVLLAGHRADLTSRAVLVGARLAFFSGQLALLVCFALAIGRHHLWRVDLVINRSLVYGGVTALLLVVFLIAGILAQTAFGAAHTSAVFALSITLAGLLFSPARDAAQRFVDRRLFGLRFDLGELQRAQRLPAIKNPGLLSGQTLGRYRVLGLLGRGGMGEVYQGECDGRHVAIKTVTGAIVGRPDFRKWFERESDALAALTHRHIVRFHESGERAGIHYIVLDFIDGRDLAGMISERGRIPLAEVRVVVAHIAAALDFAHTRGFVHRDIKPSNMMLRTTGGGAEAVLMDFGVAKIKEARTALTTTGAVGTIQYMAPEQILADKLVDFRADIYALGVSTYEMLTGELPFKGNAAQLVFAHLQEQPPNPRALCPELSSDSAEAVVRAMQKRPGDRFSSAGAFAAFLGGDMPGDRSTMRARP